MCSQSPNPSPRIHRCSPAPTPSSGNWGWASYVQGLTRLSQRTSWQDGRFALDRAASRLLTTVN